MATLNEWSYYSGQDFPSLRLCRQRLLTSVIRTLDVLVKQSHWLNSVEVLQKKKKATRQTTKIQLVSSCPQHKPQTFFKLMWFFFPFQLSNHLKKQSRQDISQKKKEALITASPGYRQLSVTYIMAEQMSKGGCHVVHRRANTKWISWLSFLQRWWCEGFNHSDIKSSIHFCWFEHSNAFVSYAFENAVWKQQASKFLQRFFPKKGHWNFPWRFFHPWKMTSLLLCQWGEKLNKYKSGADIWSFYLRVKLNQRCSSVLAIFFFFLKSGPRKCC